MKKSVGSSLLMPLATLFVVAIVIAAAIHYSSETKSMATDTYSSSSNNQFARFNHTANNFKPSEKTQYQSYAMAEPFAYHVPFESSPSAWMQMMNNMMNTMQMTQIMHQMAAIPMIMMNSTKYPHHGINTNAHANQPMSPEEYKKWYEKQLESKNFNNK